MNRAAVAPRLDTRVSVETPEGIFLDLRPAGLSARLYAFLIDWAIRLALIVAMAVPLSSARGLGQGAFFVFIFLLEWFYPVLFELTLRGATPGKRAMNLKVVMDGGLPITPGASITRNLLRVADFLPFAFGAGLLSMLTRSDFKRLGDIAAGTLVVHLAPERARPKLPPAVPVAPVRPLSAREQAVLIDLAARAERLTPERLAELAVLAASTIGAAPDATDDRGRNAAAQRLLAVAQWLIGHRAS